jgi:hypothetical protein
MENVPISTLITDRCLLIPPSLECKEAYEAFYTDGEASSMYGGPISKSAVLSRLKSDLG